MTHWYQPDPEVKDYCMCGFHRSNSQHDHSPVEPKDATLSKLIDDFEYTKDTLPSWIVELIYRLRNSESDIALKLGQKINQINDAYLQMVELKQKYELEADQWKLIAEQQSLQARGYAQDIDTLQAAINKLKREQRDGYL